MNYITIRARDKDGNILYEKDADASIFNIVALHITSGLCLHGKMGQNEMYSLFVIPHYDGEPKHEGPELGTIPDDGTKQQITCGIQLLIDPKNTPSETPVKYFTFTLLSQKRLFYQLELSANQLGYMCRAAQEALIKGGYLEPKQEIWCEYLVSPKTKPLSDERILIEPREGFEFAVKRRGCNREDLPKRQLADYPNRKLVGQETSQDILIVLIQDDVLERIQCLARDGEEGQKEIAGLLIGQPYQDSQTNRLLVDIQDIVPADNTHATPISFPFTVKVQDQLDRQSRAKEKVISLIERVGWYHSHLSIPGVTSGSGPVSNIFFSERDCRVHKEFREPWQFALVICGTGSKLRVYRWSDDNCNRIVECQGFYIYSAKDSSIKVEEGGENNK